MLTACAMTRATEARARGAGGAASTPLGSGVSWPRRTHRPRLLRLPGARQPAGATPELGCGVKGLRPLRWVRDPECSLWGPEGPLLRGDEEPQSRASRFLFECYNLVVWMLVAAFGISWIQC